MKITFIASEANPFIKTGGLADVIYSLAQEFINLNNEVNIIIPFYSRVRENITLAVDFADRFVISLGWRQSEVSIYHVKFHDIHYYFVENDRYFARRNIYGEEDDNERFACFSIASYELIKRFDLRPDIVHVHDWQAGMIPCLIKERHDEYYQNIDYFFLEY